jgi:hypothetical protein
MFTNPIINRIIIGSAVGFVGGYIVSRFMKTEIPVLDPPVNHLSNLFEIERRYRNEIKERDAEIMSNPTVAYFFDPNIPVEKKLERMKKNVNDTEN